MKENPQIFTNLLLTHLEEKDKKTEKKYIGGTSIIDENGVYHTNDCAILYDDGGFEILGRMDTLIVLGSGYKIFPEEVEQKIIKQFDDILDCLLCCQKTDQQERLILKIKVRSSVKMPEDFLSIINQKLNDYEKISKKTFLDLGCGIGRHAILFAKNGFNVKCMDICEESVELAKKRAEKENLFLDCSVGDLVSLPYKNESLSCILCYNVISHIDTDGFVSALSEIYRVLEDDGECYMTLCSKQCWGYKQDWPGIDNNTKLRMIPGPEYGVPHFFVDYPLIIKLFDSFSIINVIKVESFKEQHGETKNDYHFHILVKK